MNEARRPRSKTALLAGALLCLLNAPAAVASQATSPEQAVAAPKLDSFDKNLVVFAEVLALVRTAYVDERGDRLMAGALDGLGDALDPFSTYVPAGHVDGHLDVRKVGSQHSGAVVLKERGIAYVVAVEKDGPAAAAGVAPGDILAKVNDRSTHLMAPWEIQELLAGKPGTKLDLELVRKGEPRKVSMTLSAFELPPPSLSTSMTATVLRVPTFDAATATAVKTLLAEAAAETTKAGLVVDVRGVSTGDPEAAYATAALFAEGELGSLSHREEELQEFASKQPPVWRGRLVVLVDRGTLGAAEILATVLRQKASAELVGEETFGHAGRQGSAALSNGGRLFFTEAFYSGPDGKPLREGLRPDLKVDERSRTLPEKGVPMSDLILKRGVGHLLGGKDARP